MTALRIRTSPRAGRSSRTRWIIGPAALLFLALFAIPESLAPGQAFSPVASAAEIGSDASPDYEDYWSWEEIVRQVRTYEREYPDLVRVESIGRTYEGRDILAVKIASDVQIDDAERPEVLFMAGIHPREQPPQVALMEFMAELIRGYGSDARVTRLLDTRQVWMIPVFNVDGKVYDFANGNGTYGANQRLSRRPFGEGRVGVDLNRNGVVGWGSASDTPGSSTFHGPGPISEPESQALFEFMESRRFRVFLDIHSSLEAFLLPSHLIREEAQRYGHLTRGLRARQRQMYSGSPRSGETEARALGGTGAGQTHVTGFYVHGAYSFVYEIGPGGDPARFYPTRAQILEHYRENVREPWYFLLEEAGGLPDRSPGDFALVDYGLSEPLEPGSLVEVVPQVEGDVAYGVLVSRDPAIRVTGEYRLYPLRQGGHVLNVAEGVEPGTEVPLQLYLWDRERRRSVIDVTVTVGEAAVVEDAGAAGDAVAGAAGGMP